MAKKGEKILTQIRVKKLGLDKLSVITADMLEGYTCIGDNAFCDCKSLTSIEIPDGVTSIGGWAFTWCKSLTSVTIPNSVTRIGSWTFVGCIGLTSIKIPDSIVSIGCGVFSYCKFEQKKKIDKQGRVIAYKGFQADMTCRHFQYKEGETYEIEGDPILCEHGFHACLNPLDCFRYYCGQIGKDIVFHEVYLEEVLDEKSYDSKVVARKITIGREISLSEMADIASGMK